MRILKGVVLHNLKRPMRKALMVCDEVFEKVGLEFVVTSGQEGQHWAGSLHFYGYAFDGRRYPYGEIMLPVGVSMEEILQLIRAKLGPEYDVILEPNHFHVEWDKAKELFDAGSLSEVFDWLALLAQKG